MTYRTRIIDISHRRHMPQNVPSRFAVASRTSWNVRPSASLMATMDFSRSLSASMRMAPINRFRHHFGPLDFICTSKNRNRIILFSSNGEAVNRLNMTTSRTLPRKRDRKVGRNQGGYNCSNLIHLKSGELYSGWGT